MALPTASLRHICRILRVPRSALYPSPIQTSVPTHAGSAIQDDQIIARIHEHPTYGYRRIWALLRFRDQLAINHKRVDRLMRHQRWLLSQRRVTPKPRVQRQRSVSTRRNQRRAMDVTHIPVGRDGWAHLTAVIECYDRELGGFEFALRGRAKEAERALESACLLRFGAIRPSGDTPILRSNNGLIFQSRRFREACALYRLDQEYMTPYRPEQNGLIERFFRSLKEECVWQHTFESFVEAKHVISAWITWYNEARLHQALGYRSPRQFQQRQQAA